MARVLIVGAGPTGLALALSCRLRGISARLIEAKAERDPHSRALAIQSRTMEVFAQLGVEKHFLDAAVILKGLTLHDAASERRFDFVHVHPRFPSAVILPQDETERLLEQAGAVPERGVEFVGLADGGARLRLADETVETVAADWVVGCDGAHSAVRHALGVDFPGSRYEAKLILADCAIPELRDPRVHAWPSDERVMLAFPMPGDLWRVIRFLPNDAPDPEPGSMAPFAKQGLSFGPPIWWSQFNISQRQVETMRHDRVLLAGDAAHIHSPAGGQGMNLGIQDAWSLARAIGQGEAAVDAWAAERHAVARSVLRMTDRATRMAMSRSALIAPFRAKLMGLVLGQEWAERRIETAFAGMNYPAIMPNG